MAQLSRWEIERSEQKETALAGNREQSRTWFFCLRLELSQLQKALGVKK